MDFWLDIRREYLPDDFDGGGYCLPAAKHLSKELENKGIENKIYRYCGKEIYPITSHFWIEYIDPESQEKLIADPTAGQIDERFPQGFYGSTKILSPEEKLVKIYFNRSRFYE